MNLASRFIVLVLAVSSAVLLAGCGGGGPRDVPANAVAVVGDETITNAEFLNLLEYAKRTYSAQKRPFPKVGTPEYVQLRNQAMEFLVQRARFEVMAEDLDIDVSDKQVDERIEQYKRERHGGDDAKYRAELASQGLTEDQAREIIKANLIQEAVYKKVTADVKVTDEDVEAYYKKNKQSYGQPESREVRHILVKNKAKADQVYQQLRAGASFAALAKKFSTDTVSKRQGGKLTVSKGQTVPSFDRVAFSLDKNEVSRPVKTQYGWHVIQALTNVKAAKPTPLSQVKEAIRQQLLQEKRNDVMKEEIEDAKKDLDDKTAYQVGYEPPKTETETNGTTSE